MILKFILSIFIILLTSQSYACKCEGPATVKESFKSAELIVYGKVVKKDTVLFSETIEKEGVNQVKEWLKDDKQKLFMFEMTKVIKVQLQIVEMFKGNPTAETVVIYTPLLSASCGYRFENGTEYIIYASKKNFLDVFFNTGDRSKENTFWTTHCTRTTAYKKLEADELRTLKHKDE